MVWYGGRYYYTTITTGAGLRLRQYIGTGEKARIAARRDAARTIERRAEHAASRTQRETIRVAETQLSALCANSDITIDTALVCAGFWQPRPGPWRKRQLFPARTPLRSASVPNSTTSTDIIRRARKGDEDAIAQVRTMWKEDPALLDNLAIGGVRAFHVWISRYDGGMKLRQLALTDIVERMRAELLGSSPSPLERLLVERIVTCWLAVECAEYDLASSSKNNKPSHDGGRFLSDRLDAAHKRYISAIRALAQVRRLELPIILTQLNIADKQLNITTPAMNSPEPAINTSPTTRQIKTPESQSD